MNDYLLLYLVLQRLDIPRNHCAVRDLQSMIDADVSERRPPTSLQVWRICVILEEGYEVGNELSSQASMLLPGIAMEPTYIVQHHPAARIQPSDDATSANPLRHGPNAMISGSIYIDGG